MCRFVWWVGWVTEICGSGGAALLVPAMPAYLWLDSCLTPAAAAAAAAAAASAVL